MMWSKHSVRNGIFRCRDRRSNPPFCLAETDAETRTNSKKPAVHGTNARITRGVRYLKTGWWCAQSYANPSQRRFHTGNRGNPLFSAFLSQNGEFKSKGFRYPCVLSVGFRAM